MPKKDHREGLLRNYEKIFLRLISDEGFTDNKSIKKEFINLKEVRCMKTEYPLEPKKLSKGKKRRKNRKQNRLPEELIDQLGNHMIDDKVSQEIPNFFVDLNYGDLIIKFPNSFYDFMLKERRILKDKENRRKAATEAKQKGRMSKKELRKFKVKQAQLKEKEKNEYEVLLQKVQQKNPPKIKLSEALLKYDQQINLTTEINELTKEYLKDEKVAFLNALLFFSKDICYYDMKDIGSQFRPFAPKASVVLKNFADESERTKDSGELTIEQKMVYIQTTKDKSEKKIKMPRHLDSFLFEYHKFINKKTNEFEIDSRIFKYLLRKVIIIKMERIGLWTRQFYSEDLQHIFVVLKAQTQTLINRADVEKISKQLELGYVDIFSLEAVDKKLRPIRKKPKNFLELEGERQRKKVLLGGEDQLEEEENKGDNDPDNHITAINPTACEIKAITRMIAKAEKLSNEVLFQMLVYQQRETESDLRDLSKALNLPGSSTGVIYGDKMLNRRKAIDYYCFNALLHFWCNRLEKYQKVEVVKAFYGFLYRLAYMKAIGDANEALTAHRKNFFLKCFGCGTSKRPYIKTIWDKLKTEPISPFTDFDKDPSLYFKWRNYEINERNQRDIFKGMERIKLVNSILTESINIFKLIEDQDVIEYFPLHDYYILKFEPKENLFEKFDSVMLHTNSEDYEEMVTIMEGMKDEADEADFIKEPLVTGLALNWCHPTKLNIDHIQNYFGEKIALYFTYVQYYTRGLKLMALMGLILFFLDLYFVDKSQWDNLRYLRLITSLITVVWTTLFLEYWIRKQKMFAVKYGQLDFEQKEQERPGFKGKYVRDLATSQMNVLYYSSLKRSAKKAGAYFLSMMIIIASIAATIMFLILKNYLNTRLGNPATGFKKQIVTVVPAVLNSIQVGIFGIIYNKIGIASNFFENHKSLTSFEDSLILKIYGFGFFNTLNSLFIIAFMKKNWGTLGNCIASGNPPEELECFGELQTQVRSFFLVQFFVNFLEILIPAIKACFKKKATEDQIRKYEWGPIDAQIESDSKLEPFQTTLEIDGVLNEYLEVVIQFTFLSLFGIAFPASFFLAYLTMISEIHIDKKKLLNYVRRPVPKGASDIGTWEYILEFVSFICIFVNAGTTIFTTTAADPILTNVFNYKFKDENGNDIKGAKFAGRLQAFIITVFVLLAVKWLIKAYVTDIPSNIQNVLKRHDNILENLKFGKSNVLNLMRAGFYQDFENDTEVDWVINYDKVRTDENQHVEDKSQLNGSVVADDSESNVSGFKKLLNPTKKSHFGSKNNLNPEPQEAPYNENNIAILPNEERNNGKVDPRPQENPF